MSAHNDSKRDGIEIKNIHIICDLKEFLLKKIAISMRWEHNTSNTLEYPTKTFWEGQRLAFEETLKKIEEKHDV